jgi:GPH family glycoside/pentoside/hexuronide:cation symporter
VCKTRVGLGFPGPVQTLATLSRGFLVTPTHPYWRIISAALIGTAVIGVWIILPSMQTDVIDYEELQTGCRGEGSYTAILGSIQKLGFALSLLAHGTNQKPSRAVRAAISSA